MLKGWFSEQQRWRLPRDANLQQWLALRSSMTIALQHFAGGKMAVNILSQSWQTPTRDEALLLGLPPNRYCLIREVELSVAGRLLMIARTVMPAGQLTRQYQMLPGLTGKALGTWLFANSAMARSKFQFKQVTSADALCKNTAVKNFSKDELLWGRRSIFSMPQQKLLLTEIILPEMLK